MTYKQPSDGLKTGDPLRYKDAGVDIEAGNELVRRIGPLAARTARDGVVADLGGFGALFDLKQTRFKDPVLVSGTDGVGTKVLIAIESDMHETIGIDLVAMCVNDLIVQGAEPLFFLDYFASGKLEMSVAEAVVSGIAEACKEAGAALIGGETAEMPGMYAAGHYDLAGFCVGAVERSDILPKSTVLPGDVILGLGASGVHSNGFSLVRRIIDDQGLTWSSPAPFETDTTLAQTFLTPTRIYVKSCLAAAQTGYVKAFAHITGGGLLENIPRVLSDNVSVEIDATRWPMLPVFKWMKAAGNVPTDEMYRAFNTSIGMIAVVAPEQSEAVETVLRNEGESVYRVGRVVERGAANAEAVRILNEDDPWHA